MWNSFERGCSPQFPDGSALDMELVYHMLGLAVLDEVLGPLYARAIALQEHAVD